MAKERSDYDKARRRVKEKKEFYKHLTSFAVINIFLFLLNMFTSPGVFWFQWTTMGWGIGLLFHYFNTFGFPGIDSNDPSSEERAIEAEMRRMKSKELPDEDAAPLRDELELKEMEKQTATRKKWDDSELV